MTTELKEEMKLLNNIKMHLKVIVKYQELPENIYNAHHLFVIEVDNRKGLYEFLKENNDLCSNSLYT